MVVGDELWEQGYTLYNEGEGDEAAALWREVLCQNPDHANARYNLGVVLHEGGDAEAAVAEWRETVNISRHRPL